MKQIKEIEKPITNEEFIKILSRLQNDGKIAITGMQTFSILTGHEDNVILLDDSTCISEIVGEEDYQKALDSFPKETEANYLLIKTTEKGSIGGNSREVVLIGHSTEKEVLRKNLMEIAEKALDDDEVEFIGDYDKENFVLDDSYIGDEFIINFFIDNMDMYHRDIYNIIKE